MIPPNGVKRKFDGVANIAPFDKGCEVPDGELTHQQLDENDSESFADSVDACSGISCGPYKYKITMQNNFNNKHQRVTQQSISSLSCNTPTIIMQ